MDVAMINILMGRSMAVTEMQSPWVNILDGTDAQYWNKKEYLFFLAQTPLRA